MTVRFYSSIAQQTTLTGTYSPSATSIAVAGTTGFPSSTPYTLSLDYGQPNEELVEVTAVAGLSLTVTRAIDGTSATTHNAGAVVRHVSSARDFADSRAHENASTGVHGLAVGSALVGTTDTQTLTNKTLTSPTINSPTIAGSPSITGNSTITGATTINNNTLTITRTNTTDFGILTGIPGDTQFRWRTHADGTLEWGPGGASNVDVNFSRISSGVVGTNGRLQTLGGLDIQTAATDTIQFKASSTNSGAVMTRWRDSTNNSVAQVDDRGAAQFASVSETAPTGWIDFSASTVWTTSTGAHTPSFGNAVKAYYYKVIGGTLFASFAVTFGSTTNFGAGATTGDNWMIGLPGGLLASTPFRNTRLQAGFGTANQSVAATSSFQVRVDSTGGFFMFDTATGQQDGNALANTGFIDSLTPTTWANAQNFSFSVQVPIV